jgi:hypothetical protein
MTKLKLFSQREKKRSELNNGCSRWYLFLIEFLLFTRLCFTLFLRLKLEFTEQKALSCGPKIASRLFAQLVDQIRTHPKCQLNLKWRINWEKVEKSWKQEHQTNQWFYFFSFDKIEFGYKIHKMLITSIYMGFLKSSNSE